MGRVLERTRRRTTLTVVDVIREHAEGDADRPGVVYLDDGDDETVVLTRGQLDERARSVAAQLQELAAPGDRVLLIRHQGLDFLVDVLGCLYAGMVAVPRYPPELGGARGGAAMLRVVAADCTPAVALAGVAVRDCAAAELPPLRWVASDGVSGDGSAWRRPELDGAWCALLQYTSGSTSEPKGVMVTHANLLHNERMMLAAFGHDESPTVVTWLPLYHDMGLIASALQTLFAGGELVLMPPLAFVKRPLRWLRAISRYGAHTSGGPNFAYELCARRASPEQCEGLDLSGWEVAFNGAEPIRASTLERFGRAFADYGFRLSSWQPCYGLAEVTVFATGAPEGRRPVVRTVATGALAQGHAVDARDGRALVSSGRAWHDRAVAIVDPESRVRRPAGRIGEIWLAGADVAAGYWGRPDESHRTFRATLADTGEGPFLRTGDLGFVLEGELFVTGRIKDVIVVAGLNHYPQDIELTVEASHPRLRAGCSGAVAVEGDDAEHVAVVAEVDRELSAAPPSEEGDRELEAIARAVTEAVAREHGLGVADVALIRSGTIAKTSSGKIQRSACRAGLAHGGLDVVKRFVSRSLAPSGRP